ncbi:GNAT family N-acetyltransferase [Neobacillus sp. YIM B06451]|uniref:GNAT family N-acetyltransferase n=1 Tax=Neobacillus sp. YIM B06451 TaxID=3070994 RepID=UPI00292ECC99|nr:GNAT family N-acetyltransferase [Neobacillus sp. YIM B06451]
MRSIYMDSRWGNLQQEKENGEAITYTFKKNGTKIIYPFIKREAGIVDQNKYFDLVTPRGVCGPWIEDFDEKNVKELVSEFNDEFSHFCTKENIIAEFIQFSPWLNHSSFFNSIYQIRPYGIRYCTDLTIDFFNNEYSSKLRNAIRKAEKNGVQIIIENPNKDVIGDFLKLYSFIESKYKVSGYYTLNESYLNYFVHAFSDKIVFASAMYEGKVISSTINLLGEDIAHGIYAAHHPEYTSFQANSLLIYKLSLYAAEKGLKIFDLGGAKMDSPLEKYKRNYGKQYQYKVGTIIRNHEIYNILVEQAGGNNKEYFPQYRSGS